MIAIHLSVLKLRTNRDKSDAFYVLRLISSQWNFARGAEFPLSFELLIKLVPHKSSQDNGNSAPRAKFHGLEISLKADFQSVEFCARSGISIVF